LNSLFSFLSLRYFRKRLLKTFLTLLGIATGIAVFVSVDLTNRSILNGLKYSFDQISGGSDYTIEGRARRLTAADFQIVENLPESRAIPVIESEGRCIGQDASAFTVMGIDPMTRAGSSLQQPTPEIAKKFIRLIAEPGTILLPDSLAKRCDVREADLFEIRISGHAYSFKAILLSESESQDWPATVAWVDLATADESFGGDTVLTRIEIELPEEHRQSWQRHARKRLPPGLSVAPTGKRLEFQGELLKAFQLNLEALSMVAIFVSGFIVFNAASLAVLYRRKEIGILRALGATRGQIADLFLGETLLLGLLGSLLGILLGWALSRAVFGSVLTTVRDLYLAQASARLQFTPSSAVLATGLGLLVTFFGALLPLAETLSIAPVEATRRLSYEKYLRKRPLWPLLIAGFSALLTVLLVSLSATVNPSLGFAATISLLAACLFLTPYFARSSFTLFRWLGKKLRFSPLQVAAAQMKENSYRYSVVTAAFALGIALWIGVGTMIASFRDTVTSWIEASIRGDIYLTLADNRRGEFRAFMPESLLEALRPLPELERLDTLRAVTVFSGDDKVALSAVALPDLMANRQLPILTGSADPLLTETRASEEPLPAVVAEPLARRKGWKAGDSIRIDTEWGSWPLRIAAIVQDYTSERGLIYMDRDDFRKISGDARVNSIALYLKNPVHAPEISRRIAALPGLPPGLSIQSTEQLRSRILGIFEQTFRVTEALKYVALIVAFLGILMTLASLLEEKYREIGILQAVGMDQSDLTYYGLSQGILLAIAGFALGGITGIALCIMLLKVIHLNYFGWTIFFRPDLGLLLKSLLLTLVVGATATLYPIRILRRIQPAAAIRYEE